MSKPVYRNALFEHLKEHQLGEHVLPRRVKKLPQAVREESGGREPPDLSEQRVRALERKCLLDGESEQEDRVPSQQLAAAVLQLGWYGVFGTASTTLDKPWLIV